MQTTFIRLKKCYHIKLFIEKSVVATCLFARKSVIRLNFRILQNCKRAKTYDFCKFSPVYQLKYGAL